MKNIFVSNNKSNNGTYGTNGRQGNNWTSTANANNINNSAVLHYRNVDKKTKESPNPFLCSCASSVSSSSSNIIKFEADYGIGVDGYT